MIRSTDNGSDPICVRKQKTRKTLKTKEKWKTWTRKTIPLTFEGAESGAFFFWWWPLGLAPGKCSGVDARRNEVYLMGPGWEAERGLHCDGGVALGFADDQSPVVKATMTSKSYGDTI